MNDTKSYRQTILISGGTGLIGTHLSILLEKNGYRVIHLSRRRNLTARFAAYQWNIEQQTIDLEAIAQADAIVHLAGANVGNKRWTHSAKQNIINSRIQSTQLLANALKSVPNKVNTFIGASAVGIYGHADPNTLFHEEYPLPEAGSPQSDFLSHIAHQWEAGYQALQKDMPQLRLAVLRIGVVLAKEGGALPKMLLPAKVRIINYLGNGLQIMPWIHVHDVCQMICFVLQNPQLNGTFNAAAPQPVSNKQFAQNLAAVLPKKTVLLPVPAIILKIAMGEMAQIVLNGCCPTADKIRQAGFQFQFPDLKNALNDLLKK